MAFAMPATTGAWSRSQAGDSLAARLAAGEAICAPHLIDAEVGQVLRRFVLRGAIHRTSAAAMVRDMMVLPVRRYPHTVLLASWFSQPQRPNGDQPNIALSVSAALAPRRRVLHHHLLPSPPSLTSRGDVEDAPAFGRGPHETQPVTATLDGEVNTASKVVPREVHVLHSCERATKQRPVGGAEPEAPLRRDEFSSHASVEADQKPGRGAETITHE